jgi:hypothetical protein
MMAELQDLKPGDLVVRRSGYGIGSYTTHRVARVTATQIILADDVRYRISNGRQVGVTGSGIPTLHNDQGSFHRARKEAAERTLERGFPLTREGIAAARKAAQVAEDFLDANDRINRVFADLPTKAPTA